MMRQGRSIGDAAGDFLDPANLAASAQAARAGADFLRRAANLGKGGGAKRSGPGAYERVVLP